MIIQQHLDFIKERNLVIKQGIAGFFVFKKGHRELGRYFWFINDNVKQTNIYKGMNEGTDCTLEKVCPRVLPYVLNYISDNSSSLFYYKRGDVLALCTESKHHDNAIIIRNHDNIYRQNMFMASIRIVPVPPIAINIQDAQIVRNPGLEHFIVVDNTERRLYITKSEICQYMERETCVEALDIAYNLLKKLHYGTTNFDKIEIPPDVLERIKVERPNYYSEIVTKNKGN